MFAFVIPSAHLQPFFLSLLARSLAAPFAVLPLPAIRYTLVFLGFTISRLETTREVSST